MKIIVIFVSIFFISCNTGKKIDNIQTLDFWNMGTSLSIKYISDKKDINLENRIKNYISKFDIENSFYKKESYISKLNNSYNQFIKVPKYFCKLIERSIKYSKDTKGRFDITYKSKIFANRNSTIFTDCKNSQIKLLKKGIILDTGGIAKGYSIDQVAKLIKNNHYKNFLINFGGDTLICGEKNGKNWSVGVKDPYSKKYLKIISKDILRPYLLDNDGCYSVATSGDYERYIVKNNKKLSHIIDPKTRKSIEGAHSITVIAKNATIADTLATAISVGYKDLEYIKRMKKKYNLEIFLLTGKNLKIKEIR